MRLSQNLKVKTKEEILKKRQEAKMKLTLRAKRKMITNMSKLKYLRVRISIIPKESKARTLKMTRSRLRTSSN